MTSLVQIACKIVVADVAVNPVYVHDPFLFPSVSGMWFYDGDSGTRWPFIAPDDQIAWKAECCVEKHILKGSEREVMCQSILPKKKADSYHGLDLKSENQGIAAFVGEEETLVWTDAGVRSSLGKPGWAITDHPVSDGFLQWQPISVTEGLRLGYWRRVPKVNYSFSMLQTSFNSTGPDDMVMCTEEMRKWYAKSSVKGKGWKFFSRKSVCVKSTVARVASPQACLEHPFKEKDIKARVFEYDKNQEKNPVACWILSLKFTCSRKKLKPFLAEANEVNFDDVRFYMAEKR